MDLVTFLMKGKYNDESLIYLKNHKKYDSNYLYVHVDKKNSKNNNHLIIFHDVSSIYNRDIELI